MANFSFPNFNIPFPYANLPQQLQASMQGPQLTNAGQYGRWNGFNGNYFGLAPSSWPSLFGSPVAPQGQWQLPFGNNGGIGMNSGPGASPGGAPLQNVGTYPQMPTIPGSQLPQLGNGYTRPPMSLPLLPTGDMTRAGAYGQAPTSQVPMMQQSGVRQIASAPQEMNYSQGSMWGGNGPINAGSLSPQDQLYLRKFMQLSGSGGANLASQLLGGSNTAVRNAINAPQDAAVTNYDPSTYNGALKPYIQQYLQQHPLSYQFAGQTYSLDPNTFRYGTGG